MDCQRVPTYPGYQPLPGALGEYNGKFMCNQMGLRVAPVRRFPHPAYLSEFPPPKTRWQFTRIRLAKDER
jgi:hypothetical protein